MGSEQTVAASEQGAVGAVDLLLKSVCIFKQITLFMYSNEIDKFNNRLSRGVA